ncbi:MAG: MarR family transcriptional regulator [Rhizomicrobium sp.]|jgi:DNA-binding MarR family transcriptional regulator
MVEEADFLTRQGARALSTRLRRLYEALNQGVAAAYREAGIAFEPRWFGLMTLMRSRSSVEIGEAAAVLGQSHVAVVQVANALESRRLIRRTASRADKRRRALAITAKGEALCVRLDPLWDVVQRATDELLHEAAPRFLEQLDALDAALMRMPLDRRIHQLATKSKRKAAP